MRLTYRFCIFTIRWVIRIVFGLEVRGLEKIPKQGRAIIAANHQSYLDPPVIGSNIRRELKYLTKEELLRIPILGGFLRYIGCIPVRRSSLDLEALRRAARILEGDEALLLFPEGHRGRTEGLRPGLGGVGFLASQTNSDVYPIYLENTRGSWKRLIKREKIQMIVGDPIRFSQYQNLTSGKKSEAYRAFSEEVMNQIAAMKAAQ